MITSENTIDVPLLRKALEHVTAHPETWRQGMWLTKSLVVDGTTYTKDDAVMMWSTLDQVCALNQATWCGTTACLAGHVAVTILGGIPVFKDDAVSSGKVDMGDGNAVPVMEVAQNALGLTVVQADYLFSANNDLAALWRFANRFTDGEIEVPSEFR